MSWLDLIQDVLSKGQRCWRFVLADVLIRYEECSLLFTTLLLVTLPLSLTASRVNGFELKVTPFLETLIAERRSFPCLFLYPFFGYADLGGVCSRFSGLLPLWFMKLLYSEHPS